MGYSPWGRKKLDTTERLSTAMLYNRSSLIIQFLIYLFLIGG